MKTDLHLTENSAIAQNTCYASLVHGSLFSGIGGFDLAAEWMGWENAFHCEWIENKRKKLEIRFPNSKSYGDISTTDFTIWRNKINVLTGGFPCQDASIAKQDGKGQQGLQGERTGLFFEFCRGIREIKPKFIVAENVANILKTNNGQDFGRILTELSAMGYNAEWRICRASEVGAPHHRARLYLVAYSNSIRLQKGQTFFSNVQETTSPKSWKLHGTSLQIVRGGSWSSEPPALCVDDGVSGGLVREQLHGFGNAIVPQIALQIFKAVGEYMQLSSEA
ncbi:DNA cytosine methyltransferase [Flavobacterium geliluteum]|uniref:DNA (cytosine-5-)-methyltransferase n=1 Tax=Flavobacterium geliluteum TaxID=2816120 RepID=A0A941AVC7_9FLAO|nr:DNA (cytosine-5-)-methyltransferase [Flavobacterium geliluteum]MBP4137439.1 DNA (cytosine-5-)-methyltransferase [Flavobacterium geliluteum]